MTTAAKRLQHQDVELAYWEHGSGDGPPLLLVHGFTGSSLDWADVVEPLARDRRVVTFDHRGHGESTNLGDEAAYSFEQLTDDLTALVDALELAPFDLLGHSMGGMVGMRYVLRDPAPVRSLILMDTAAQPHPAAIDWMKAGIDIARTQGMPALGEIIAPFVPEGMLRDRLLVKYGQMDAAAFAALGEELFGFDDVLSRLAALRMPVTVIVGENDAGLRPAADDLAATIPGAILNVIPNAAHSPQDENREHWLEAVQAHLARLPAR
jgi:pimeloyl-ACP methyl ester carboxylesterase